MAADERMVQKPAPTVYLAELGDDGVELSARCWMPNTKYWTVRCGLMGNVKLAFDKEGIKIPYLQREVRLLKKPEPPSDS